MGVDQHNRTLGRCTVGGTDVNRTTVALGYAVGFRRYSFDYVSSEEAAKLNKRGIWAGTFQQPSHYRGAGDARPAPRAEGSRGHRRATGPGGRGRTATSRIILHRRGQWIYHVPGMPYYDATPPRRFSVPRLRLSAAGYRRAIVK